MPDRSYTCRFCGDSFLRSTATKKPGYINECDDCFRARTTTAPPADAISRLERMPEGRRSLNQLRRLLIKKGFDPAEADRRIAKALEAEID